MGMCNKVCPRCGIQLDCDHDEALCYQCLTDTLNSDEEAVQEVVDMIDLDDDSVLPIDYDYVRG